jgi:hypothetical protein
MNANKNGSANTSSSTAVNQQVGQRGANDSLQSMMITLKALEESQWKIARQANSAMAARRHEELALSIVSALEIIRRLKAASLSIARR